MKWNWDVFFSKFRLRKWDLHESPGREFGHTFLPLGMEFEETIIIEGDTGWM